MFTAAFRKAPASLLAPVTTGLAWAAGLGWSCLIIPRRGDRNRDGARCARRIRRRDLHALTRKTLEAVPYTLPYVLQTRAYVLQTAIILHFKGVARHQRACTTWALRARSPHRSQACFRMVAGRSGSRPKTKRCQILRPTGAPGRCLIRSPRRSKLALSTSSCRNRHFRLKGRNALADMVSATDSTKSVL